ncbi:D-2-hydroxyacid dehydrogenase [Vibrio marisflavi]|uniref:Hydroxypyruvate reductase n=1 Tax=Vibrio marisflavi CECT 7928 TaxID=634439 RepID=A0ABN8E2W6_9VIBR|nr:D-2-hydroxyacid dehydrogenase [Vibrio marisflavi]CAH0539102.1 Hydroxypyruvate reductase [Vibrio marisflavi CECT 7928]
MKTIVCLDGYTLNPGDNPWQPIESLGNFICYDRSTAGTSQVISRAKPAHILLTNKAPISKEVIDACPNLECIVVLATGYNVVDIEYAKEKNIPVLNVPSYGTDTVAEMVFAHIFQFARNVALNSQDVRDKHGWTNSNDWSYWLNPQLELAGKTIGIVGFGKIGQRVGELAHAFKMNVLAHEHFSHTPPNYPHHTTDLDTLLSQSDFVSLHCPALPTTENLIRQQTLAKMKRSALLINTSRGQLIDEQDLANALNNQVIAGAALDVLWQEPPETNNPLLTAKNCVITPHLAWATLDARKRITQMVAKNIQSFISGNLQNVVN